MRKLKLYVLKNLYCRICEKNEKNPEIENKYEYGTMKFKIFYCSCCGTFLKKYNVKNIKIEEEEYCDSIGVYNSCTCTEPKRLYHIENKLYYLCSECHKERRCKK